MEIETVLDLLTHYPRRYIDRTQQAEIRDLRLGEEAMVLARVKRSQLRRTRQGRSLVEIDVFDGSGYLKCTFFNQAWRAKQLKEGTEAVFFGKLEHLQRPSADDQSRWSTSSATGPGASCRSTPSRRRPADHVETSGGSVAEALRRPRPAGRPGRPERWRDELDLVDRTWAFQQIHGPESLGAAQAARKRLAFDELLRLQVTLVMRKRAVERESPGHHGHGVDGELVDRFQAPAVPADRRPAAGHRRDRRRPGRPPPHAPAPAGRRRRRARPSWRSAPC